jgi:hypothetical protein
LGGEWALRNPPRLAVATPLPCDLAHRISIEFEKPAVHVGAGQLIVGGQGIPHRGQPPAEPVIQRFDLGPIAPLPSGAIERSGVRRLRAWLKADPELGWADPDVRSVWPGEIATNWVEVEIVRL